MWLRFMGLADGGFDVSLGGALSASEMSSSLLES
jgi:hypothetical protein